MTKKPTVVEGQLDPIIFGERAGATSCKFDGMSISHNRTQVNLSTSVNNSINFSINMMKSKGFQIKKTNGTSIIKNLITNPYGIV